MYRHHFVNEEDQHFRTSPGTDRRPPVPDLPGKWQPRVTQRHRRGDMSFVCGAIALMLAAISSPLSAQQPAPVAASAFSSTLRPALAQVGQTLNRLNIRKWKAPNSVRSAAQGDVDSIQRDLTGTLAVLLARSDGAPASIPAGFAVYRNVNALYDTLLRVVETAGLSAPDEEASSLDAALNQLEAARSSLADEISHGIETQESEVVHLRAVITAAAAAPRTTRTTVVDDGPNPAVHHHARTTKKRSTTQKGKEETPKSQQKEKTPQ
jgi:hypothetical protein